MSLVFSNEEKMASHYFDQISASPKRLSTDSCPREFDVLKTSTSFDGLCARFKNTKFSRELSDRYRTYDEFLSVIYFTV